MSNSCKDTWKGKDKAWHFGVSLVLSVVCPIVAVVAAMGKEIYDYNQQGNHFCWKDIIADLIGIILGSIIHTLIILLIC